MKLNRSERFVRGFLENINLSVDPLTPVPGRKTADFLAKDTNNIQYLFEVESQADDESYSKELEEKGRVSRTDEVLRTNVASRVVRHATKQLLETRIPGVAFNLLAIVPSTDDPGTQASEFRSTLYGIMLLVPVESDEGEQAKDCFYFDFNEFFQMKDVEGALIFWESSCQLCINTFSKRISEFRKSYLYQHFDAGGGVLDPDALEANGQVYIADIDLSRSDPDKIMDYVVEKYSLRNRPIAIRPQQLRGEMKLD